MVDQDREGLSYQKETFENISGDLTLKSSYHFGEFFCFKYGHGKLDLNFVHGSTEIEGGSSMIRPKCVHIRL